MNRNLYSRWKRGYRPGQIVIGNVKDLKMRQSCQGFRNWTVLACIIPFPRLGKRDWISKTTSNGKKRSDLWITRSRSNETGTTPVLKIRERIEEIGNGSRDTGVAGMENIQVCAFDQIAWNLPWAEISILGNAESL
nr:hypothetical protein Iba_chr12fCG7260 [Ipomoea batatas]